MKKGFTEGYKTYDPEEQGYGSSFEWKRNFYQRMSKEEAEEILNLTTTTTTKRMMNTMKISYWTDQGNIFIALVK